MVSPRVSINGNSMFKRTFASSQTVLSTHYKSGIRVPDYMGEEGLKQLSNSIEAGRFPSGCGSLNTRSAWPQSAYLPLTRVKGFHINGFGGGKGGTCPGTSPPKISSIIKTL